MENHDRKDMDDLFGVWQQAEQQLEKQNLDLTDMEKLLQKSTEELSDYLRKSIVLDIVLKLVLLSGLVILSLTQYANAFVIITTAILLILGILAGIYERKMFLGLNSINNYDEELATILNRKLEYYRANMIRLPILISLTPALFYILGSMVYKAIKYQEIEPVKDLQDAIVLGILLLFCVLISFGANYPYFKERIGSLQKLQFEMGDPEKYESGLAKINRKKRKRLIGFMMMALLGLFILLLLLSRWFS